MSEHFTCPRRQAEGHALADSPLRLDGPDKDEWRVDNGHRVCSYDGSLHPDEFMDYVRDGGEVGPTDKSYKFYLDGIEVRGMGKFYTHHLNEDQSEEFVRMHAQGRINFGYPGKPYVPLFLPGMSAERAGMIWEEEFGE